MNTLRIYIPESWHDASAPCQWALCNDAGALLQQGLAPLTALPAADEYVAVIPSQRVLCSKVDVPAGARRRWLAALPFMAEEHALPDPEDNHVVPGGALQDGLLPLFIVDKNWLRGLIEACKAAGVELRRAIPEMFLLPQPDGRKWGLVWDGHSGFVRTGPASGMALDTGSDTDAPVAFRLAAQLPPDEVEVRFPASLEASDRKFPQWRDFPLRLVEGPAWDWQCEPIPGDAPNLLWGEFSPRARLSAWLPKLRPLALILLALFLVEAVGVHVQWALLASERHELGDRMERIFQGAFGQNSAMVNAPLQMQRNLANFRHAAGLPDDGDFIPLLDQAAPAFATLPAGSLRVLNYESGQLDVVLRLAGPGEFKSLQQRLEAGGLAVRVGKVSDTGVGAEAKLIIHKGVGR